ncbi:hypothetical protein [Mesorhizobium onobrychidis]|uniref:Uncharacterized protein n=1 Tax=Mesorhizobium onobrychidis TaxID=2775404 RepID=A0ABY5RAI7_9HYPH|nr:hypothetical protein [Mesorhizobium onobrychidis]UVC19394.1 hypothetical protein IHQ72_35630 [Mesorhizobium onobrychidis]
MKSLQQASTASRSATRTRAATTRISSFGFSFRSTKAAHRPVRNWWVSVPYDAHMTFDDLATQAFEKAHAMLRACCEIDESMWWKQFNRSLEPLLEWTPGAQ